MKYFIIAGEASGDLHASNLIRQIGLQDPHAEWLGLGGDKMQAAGCKLQQHYDKMAYMGFVAVLQHLPDIRRNLRIAQRSLMEYKPDALILIDYPSFNLQIASFCKKHLPGTRIFYYIPPKIWAWKAWRVHKIARLCDQVLGIFPFEPAFYARYGYRCQYVGNPTHDSIEEWRRRQPAGGAAGERGRLIAILPGSRRSEIRRCLPTMLAAARAVRARLPEAGYRIAVAAAPGIEEAFYSSYLDGEELVRDTYLTVYQADAAVVNSGTATLETALLHCPQTAVYYIACSRWLEWLIRPIVFRTPHFTLVNIIPQKEVIQELIAARFTQANVEAELYRLLTDEAYRRQMVADYEEIERILGPEPAAQNAATQITQALQRDVLPQS